MNKFIFFLMVCCLSLSCKKKDQNPSPDNPTPANLCNGSNASFQLTVNGDLIPINVYIDNMTNVHHMDDQNFLISLLCVSNENPNPEVSNFIMMRSTDDILEVKSYTISDAFEVYSNFSSLLPQFNCTSGTLTITDYTFEEFQDFSGNMARATRHIAGSFSGTGFLNWEVENTATIEFSFCLSF